MIKSELITKVFHAFLNEPILNIEQVKGGLINDSFKIATHRNNYFLQKINRNVFLNPSLIAANESKLRTICTYKNSDFLVEAKSDASDKLFVKIEGEYWRLTNWLEDCVTFHKLDSNIKPKEVGHFLATWHNTVQGEDANSFHEIIPRFHDLSWRWDQFLTACQNPVPARYESAREAIDEIVACYFLVGTLSEWGSKHSQMKIVCHNDLKISNLLFDEITFKPKYFIDLDTIMPGFRYYDLGDCIRSFSSTSIESELDIHKVLVDFEAVDGIIKGYINGALTISEQETEILPIGILGMYFIQVLRFMTDYLNGDTYFHVSFENENFIRSRNQLQLMQQLKKHFNL